MGLLETGALEAAALEESGPGELASTSGAVRAQRTAADRPSIAQTEERAVALVGRPPLARATLVERLTREAEAAAPRLASPLHLARAPPVPGCSRRGFSSIV